MNIRNYFRTLVAVCALSAAAQASAAVILQVNSSGILTGAKGLNVDGTLYDVKFVDGSCNSLFNNCVQSAFNFNFSGTARLAAAALISQVFIDGPEGNFDSAPNKTFGCTSVTLCNTYIPYEFSRGAVYVYYSSNSSINTRDAYNGPTLLPVEIDTTQITTSNFAIFSLATLDSTVPEPSSIALMALAMAGLAFTLRRKA